jgi:hypothetical protein
MIVARNMLPRKNFRDCPDFCVNKNGTVPFVAERAMSNCIDTKYLTGPNFRAVYGPSRRRRFRPGVYAGLANRLENLLSGPFTGLLPPQFPDTLNDCIYFTNIISTGLNPSP